jgi:hypothetical protein
MPPSPRPPTFPARLRPRSGSNHHDYVQQELGRGHWKIALKQGYDFTTKDCGLWRKVG